jgi:hypothetical protein
VFSTKVQKIASFPDECITDCTYTESEAQSLWIAEPGLHLARIASPPNKMILAFFGKGVKEYQTSTHRPLRRSFEPPERGTGYGLVYF